MEADTPTPHSSRPTSTAKDSAPFSRLQFTESVCGVTTEFLLTTYSNYLFFIVTQTGKLGTLFKASCERNVEGEATYSATAVLGKRDPEMEVYARAIVEVTSEVSAKPLLLALALNETSPAIFREVLAVVKRRIV
eukprot:TRINITY_DN13056_c0_g1_i1.p1 TRINITY_DN13056_c0_g1~~TRINITY_DN13056_c0_g1_i1.p1  ORF type:complete len:135 (+),score=25.45 TRINITY_DN13056_c0_g1_i1:1-405(+)